MDVFTIKSIFSAERFYYKVYSFNVGVAKIPNQTLIRRKVKCFYINLCKYYLVVAVLVERKMHSIVCYIMFGWLVKIKSMQEDDDGRMWVASLIIWCSPWKEVVNSSCEPSIFSTLLWHQLEDLALKSPDSITGDFNARSSSWCYSNVDNRNWGLKLLRCTMSFSKVLMKWSCPSLDWLGGW